MSTETGEPPATRRNTLSREKVVAAAVAMADASDGKVPSTRKLAESLGVQAMALYHHFRNKDALLDGMVDFVFAEVELPAADADWKPAMRRRAASMREALVRHPWAIAIMDSRANPGIATLRHHDAVIGCLRAGGFTIAGAAHSFALLDSYVYGFVIQELALPLGSPEEIQQSAESVLALAPAEEFPHLTEMAVGHAMKPGYDYGDEFWTGLDLILDGLEQRRDTWR
ncbi:TetR/AcrR family transcriptional regulator [Glycomyces algeriensis]|uniref:TetR family transcriptional regulator n=1 Tax=Glycomyces algeriensis TaxID=256037 RepID=A0A9W6G7I1_9ACTN|nr:TetR/AcrR family transcriptional regulator [Glycomyces algeriensis]MDA1366187.1 TetR/AcrR family transcriptional regulator [Glycomyces algeriensis]MDR7349045.1 AcrR family transcriptional regulator [Glycomyces algeriensis]GLI41747.1 TetR family transcriptional regulator [Glycomyces algeriensis]